MFFFFLYDLGNAATVPGKLTCCGQRCPCYVESKPCLECRCRGCRNPHTADGLKVKYTKKIKYALLTEFPNVELIVFKNYYF